MPALKNVYLSQSVLFVFMGRNVAINFQFSHEDRKFERKYISMIMIVVETIIG